MMKQGRSARSLFAASALSIFMVLGCNAPTGEADPAGPNEGDLAQVEQHFTQCGTSCPSGYHPTRRSCSAITCGGTCSVGATNQVTCEPNVGTFLQCGTSCPSGWYATSRSCSTITCGGTCSFNATNQATCAPICDPKAGTHGQMWEVRSAQSQYMYQGEWCSIGTHWPPMCFQGTYYYNQQLVGQSCASVGSNGSCYDPDAWWNVSCNSLIDCVYNCNGQCEPAGC